MRCDDPTWRNKQLKRLKLYNNQARDESKVGAPLLFTVFQTVFAALYDDRLSNCPLRNSKPTNGNAPSIIGIIGNPMLDDEFNQHRSILIRELADKAGDPFIKRRLLDLAPRYEKRPIKTRPLPALGWPKSPAPGNGETR
ncbi:hypothetical protein GA0061098_103419 [Bradyrhizobium shewense]|uniref:Uncharacterized protein n=1 Tax=Bradyrhizobium shewense TaxID=1761772 RepID=A0A1C3XS86_9BRAD|nr:hypothetical protein [Bradyrhizobium shewense]SCB55045.1 hypothetical protein GA0061098_103419 [Bradyrhizobium shewense]